MNAVIEKRLFLVWLLLATISLSQLWLGSFNGQAVLTANAVTTFAVIILALVKVRIIIMEFMEARHAPKLLGRLVDAWLLLTAVTLLGIYCVGMAIA